MKVALQKIASIQIGYSFRGRLDAASTGSVAVIQMKDLVDDQVDLGGLLRVDMGLPKIHHLVRVGDLVFRSRGVTSTCAILLGDPGETIVAAPLFRIRVNDDLVLPKYLNWYINQPQTQAYLSSHAKGTAQKMISKDVLENMEIAIPPIERQREIVELAALAEIEQNLMQKLADKRKQYLSALLLKMAEGEGN